MAWGSGKVLGGGEKIHDKGVDALFINDKYVVSGGKDMTIKYLDKKTYKTIVSIDCKTVLSDSVCPKIRSLKVD
jgi:hypothetical protein